MNKARVSIQERHPWLQGVLFAFTQEMQHKKKSEGFIYDNCQSYAKALAQHFIQPSLQLT